MPSPNDPLGINDPPTPQEAFTINLDRMIEERIHVIMRGRTTTNFNNMPDHMLCLELMARGWVCYKPRENQDTP